MSAEIQNSEANNEKVEVLGQKLWASKEEIKEEMKTGHKEMKATVSIILQEMKSRREETRGLSGEAEGNSRRNRRRN
jgi:hypothetical protein